MRREFLITGDGSHTIRIPEWDEQYHSKNGSIAESRHVFIEAGLKYFILSHPKLNEISILEMGFGTGLNALLTLTEPIPKNLRLFYTALEGYPISHAEVLQLNYPKVLEQSSELFLKIHEAPWNGIINISEYFSLLKRKQLFSEMEDVAVYDIIFYDAFGIKVQPELWTETIFSQMFSALKPGGILVTYAANGRTRRALQTVGFSVERLPGPPGKWEMLRARRELSIQRS